MRHRTPSLLVAIVFLGSASLKHRILVPKHADWPSSVIEASAGHHSDIERPQQLNAELLDFHACVVLAGAFTRHHMPYFFHPFDTGGVNIERQPRFPRQPPRGYPFVCVSAKDVLVSVDDVWAGADLRARRKVERMR